MAPQRQTEIRYQWKEELNFLSSPSDPLNTTKIPSGDYQFDAASADHPREFQFFCSPRNLENAFYWMSTRRFLVPRIYKVAVNPSKEWR